LIPSVGSQIWLIGLDVREGVMRGIVEFDRFLGSLLRSNSPMIQPQALGVLLGLNSSELQTQVLTKPISKCRLGIRSCDLSIIGRVP
jgi:hypothetical protein